MARIFFLGTAGSSAVVTKQMRASGGIVLQIEDLQLHLDPGPGALVKAKELGLNLHHTSAILVSHNHINHCNDLNVVIEAMTHSGIEHRGILLCSKSLLLESEETRPFLTKYHQHMVERIISMEKKHKIGIELLEINSLPADHTDEHALGFKLLCPRFTLSYTGDTAYSEELVEELKGTDILILNVPYPENKATGKNLDVHSAIKIISESKPRLAIITHFGLEMLKADPLHEAREIQRITGIQTIAAQDGMAVTPEGYREYKGPVKGFM